jgi:hypothetical protein
MNLDRFDDTGHFALGEGLADFGQVDEHHVAQRVLCVHGDADSGCTAFGRDPFVVLGVLDAHEKTPRGKNNRECRA